VAIEEKAENVVIGGGEENNKPQTAEKRKKSQQRISGAMASRVTVSESGESRNGARVNTIMAGENESRINNISAKMAGEMKSENISNKCQSIFNEIYQYHQYQCQYQ
jgi:hypothetical protein